MIAFRPDNRAILRVVKMLYLLGFFEVFCPHCVRVALRWAALPQECKFCHVRIVSEVECQNVYQPIALVILIAVIMRGFAVLSSGVSVNAIALKLIKMPSQCH